MAKIVKQAWLIALKNDPDKTILFEGENCNSNWQVVAGPVSVEFDVPDVARCPHCHKALPGTEKPKLPLLPLVVGGVYRTGQDDLETIATISDNSQRQCPVVTKDGYSYALDGRYCPPHESSHDLIERIA